MYEEIVGQTSICNSSPLNQIMVPFGHIWNRTYALSDPAKCSHHHLRTAQGKEGSKIPNLINLVHEKKSLYQMAEP